MLQRSEAWRERERERERGGRRMRIGEKERRKEGRYSGIRREIKTEWG